ncbi:MAG: orotidine-5'-phosphate decarboxylase [Spirochaetaceae bacterium]|jgi:orotidine-5'-phosphate decarboxylase|nr:orotidine-5'-phosphate decarboxylase [Spirochaetaceae bacterium]
MDRLYEAVAERGPVCVGLDTAPGYVPPGERRRAGSDAEAVLAFNRAIVDATADRAACFKVQIAYYEAMGIPGLRAYARTLSYIRGRGSLVIADIKRGDIADTAGQYAKAHFEGDFEADFVTLSPYMGMDSLEPWLAYAGRGKGAFVLVRTSNRGMRDFEYLELADSAAGTGGPRDPADKGGARRLYHAVGGRLAELAGSLGGRYGYGAFGAVLGCTERDEAAAIRSRYGNLFFLIPGYGAQGGAAEDAALLLREGNGGVVNASRSILKAWTGKAAGKGSAADAETVDHAFAAEAAREAAGAMRDAIRKAAAEQNLM